MRSRGAVCALASLLLSFGFLASACSAKVGGEPSLGGGAGPVSTSLQEEVDLSSLDLCDILTSSDLSVLGIGEPGKPEKGIGESGCRFESEDYILDVLSNPDEGISFYEERADIYDVFERNEVNGRPGAVVVVSGGKGNGLCRQAFEVGAGNISASLTYRFGKYQGVDVCAEALRVAQLVESRLPR